MELSLIYGARAGPLPLTRGEGPSASSFPLISFAAMPFKKTRFGPRLTDAARSGKHTRDVHVFVGGTGAVGGAAVLQMLAMFEEMFAISPPADPEEVPVLMVTGRGKEDIDAFVHRLFEFLQSRWGRDAKPRKFESGYLTPSGVYVAISPFQLKPVPGLDVVAEADPEGRDAAVDEFLGVAGTDRSREKSAIEEALVSHVREAHPITRFLIDRQLRLRGYGPKPFRSLLLGVPLPTVLAYQVGALDIVARSCSLGDSFIEHLKSEFKHSFAADLSAVSNELGARVLVAHTTGVGGMYDESPDGHTTPRLGFAHASRDEFLRNKHIEAEQLTREYAARGIYMLVTAAAIGIDEVKVRKPIPLHRGIVNKLREAPYEIFRGCRAKHEDTAGDGTPRRVPNRQFIRVHRPRTLSIDKVGSMQPLYFDEGTELEPTYSIRSGENGFFSVSNADALYRVMKVATASELGHVLASVALLGDDPNVPWFRDSICYYTETANSRQAFDFLYQPQLVQTQLNGLEPLALQDLGSAKHQAELHTLALLILRHRLRTADFDTIEPYAPESFDAHSFFIASSRPLTFRDLESWDVATTASDLATMVAANRPEDLLPIQPLHDAELFPMRDHAHMKVLDAVLHAVWAITSLGSPIVFAGGIRCGYYIAPFGEIVTSEDSLRQLFEGRNAEYEMAVNGFIDVRPHGIICRAKTVDELGPDSITVADDFDSFEAQLRTLEPYSFFATCGLIAILFRLRGLGRMLREARIDLGTMQDFEWQVMRDEHGHTIVVPGAVEAFRMISEGQEKATGTEWLDGIWGYERRRPPSRVDEVLGAVKK
jgi:hypothetical protein